MTERERAIFDAGQHAGAAQMLQQMHAQHANFVAALEQQMHGRQQSSVACLDNLPTNRSLGARAGQEVGKRVRAVGKALVGHSGD